MARRDTTSSSSSTYDPALMSAIRTLSPRQRAVVYFTYWEGLTVDGSAERIGISGGSARRHLDRAKKTLHRALTKESS